MESVFGPRRVIDGCINKENNDGKQVQVQKGMHQ